MEQTRVYRILVIEDEDSIRELVKLNLELADFEVIEAADGLEGLNKVIQEKPDLVLLDLMLPKMDGYELLPKITERQIPVIILTAMNGLKDKIKGFNLGTDDYITKPFESMELLARIRAVLRRSQQTVQQQEEQAAQTLQYDDIVLHLDQHRVFHHGEEIELTLKEFELLRLLVEHKGKVLSREKLLEQVWDYGYEGNTRTVDMHIQRLRTKLQTDKISTVYKVGYRLEDDTP